MYDGQPLPMTSVAALRRRFQWFVNDHRRGTWVLAILLVVLASYPFWAGALAARIVSSQLTSRLGVPVRVARGAVRGGDNDATCGAAAIEIEGAMEGLRPALYPQVRMTEGYVRPLPTLPMTGISALFRPGSRKQGGGPVPLEIEMSGSYG